MDSHRASGNTHTQKKTTTTNDNQRLIFRRLIEGHPSQALNQNGQWLFFEIFIYAEIDFRDERNPEAELVR